MNFIFAFLYVTMSLKLTLSSVSLFQIMTDFLKKEFSMYCPLYLSPKYNFLFLVLVSIWWLSYSIFNRLAVIDVVFSKSDIIFHSPETLLLVIYCVLASSLKMSRIFHDRSKFLLPSLTVFPEISLG